VLVLKDVLEVHDPVGVCAGREHRDLVQDLHGAVDTASNPGRELGGVHDARLAVSAATNCGEEAAGIKEKFISQGVGIAHRLRSRFSPHRLEFDSWPRHFKEKFLMPPRD